MEFYKGMVARYYDLQYGDKKEDIEMYKKLARKAGENLLELACGTGRVLLPLARAGFRVTGLDSSNDMLAIARRKLRFERREVRDRVRLIKGDMRDFRLGEKFDMVFIAFNSFLHLETVEDEERCLVSVREHLKPGGFLVIDVFRPDFKKFRERQLSLDFVKRDGKNLICRFSTRTYEHEKQHIHVLFLLDVIRSGGKVKRYAESFTLRYVWKEEMKRLLRRCGFVVKGVYGWYDLSPCTLKSRQQIFVAKRG